jgi:ceramide synthetase
LSKGWKYGSEIAFDIKIIYYTECGFYFHSIYSTLYMDAKRKDFKIMLLHHIVTIALLTLSFGYRHHNLGLMVLFCHDVNDILLEFTKCNVYLRKRHGQFLYVHERVSQFGFFVFAFSWYILFFEKGIAFKGLKKCRGYKDRNNKIFFILESI